MKRNIKILITLLMAMVILPASIFGTAPEKGDRRCKPDKKMEKRMEKMKNETLANIVGKNKRFETLAAALQAAGLVETLQGEGPFTVFAPTNSAFAKLPAGTLEDLLKPENKEQLTNILTYHVTPGKVMATDVLKLDGQEITMANGEKAKITVKGDEVFINDAKVIRTDLVGKNGVIHVIDTVILPK